MTNDELNERKEEVSKQLLETGVWHGCLACGHNAFKAVRFESEKTSNFITITCMKCGFSTLYDVDILLKSEDSK